MARGDFSKTIKFLGGTITHFGRMKKRCFNSILESFPIFTRNTEKETLPSSVKIGKMENLNVFKSFYKVLHALWLS